MLGIMHAPYRVKGLAMQKVPKHYTKTVHVNDVVTEVMHALAEFLVSTLFGAFPGQS